MTQQSKERAWPRAGVPRSGALPESTGTPGPGLQGTHGDGTPEVGRDDREDLQWTGRCLHLCQAGSVTRDCACNLSEQHLFPLIPASGSGDLTVDANWWGAEGGGSRGEESGGKPRMQKVSDTFFVSEWSRGSLWLFTKAGISYNFLSFIYEPKTHQQEGWPQGCVCPLPFPQEWKQLMLAHMIQRYLCKVTGQ